MHVDAGDAIARRTDRALDLAVGALAIWTVLFHLARLVELSRDTTFVLFVVGVVVLGVVLARSGTGWAAPAGPGSAGRLSYLPVVLGLAAAALLAVVEVDGLWWPLAWLGLLGVLVAAALAVRAAGSTANMTARAVLHRTSRAAAVSVLVLAGLAALLSLVMVRPDQDDVFVVNRSAWVAAHDGAFPDRDTIFSDDVLPVQRPPALATSVEALLGSAAAAGRVSAVRLTHLGFGPLVAALAVFATWRLVRGLGARPPPRGPARRSWWWTVQSMGRSGTSSPGDPGRARRCSCCWSCPACGITAPPMGGPAAGATCWPPGPGWWPAWA